MNTNTATTLDITRTPTYDYVSEETFWDFVDLTSLKPYAEFGNFSTICLSLHGEDVLVCTCPNAIMGRLVGAGLLPMPRSELTKDYVLPSRSLDETLNGVVHLELAKASTGYLQHRATRDRKTLGNEVQL